MKTISVSTAKASLSEQLRYVQHGGEVVITDRGRPVARLTAIAATDSDVELADLERRGLVRRAKQPLARSFWRMARPRDANATVREALRVEREGGW
ncbi:MAG: type II toxin-antitoxin system prevent-host-death family antitoxin [Myxococcota bacterium]